MHRNGIINPEEAAVDGFEADVAIYLTIDVASSSLPNMT
jgi:hypothetical protein